MCTLDSFYYPSYVGYMDGFILLSEGKEDLIKDHAPEIPDHDHADMIMISRSFAAELIALAEDKKSAMLYKIRDVFEYMTYDDVPLPEGTEVRAVGDGLNFITVIREGDDTAALLHSPKKGKRPLIINSLQLFISDRELDIFTEKLTEEARNLELKQTTERKPLPEKKENPKVRRIHKKIKLLNISSLKDRVKKANQRRKYGAAYEETWCMDEALLKFLYSRIKIYTEVSPVNLEHHKFEYGGRIYTQRQMTDMIMDNISRYFRTDSPKNRNLLLEEVLDLWKAVHLAMWW